MRRDVSYFLTAVHVHGERLPIASYPRYIQARADAKAVNEQRGWHGEIIRVSVPTRP